MPLTSRCNRFEIVQKVESDSAKLVTEVITVFYSLVYHKTKNTAWLAQLVERRTAVREVSGSSPRPDQHSGS